MSNSSILPVAGARWAACAAGIKKNQSDANLSSVNASKAVLLDLALLELAPSSTISTVFTQNAFCAAPVILARQHIQRIKESNHNASIYCLINAGNANAGTGDAGYAAAKHCCDIFAEQLQCESMQVLPFSTGVIGEPLAVDKFQLASAALVERLSEESWSDAAKAILTTDTVAKAYSRQVEINGRVVTLSGIAKGAGMIKPNMATMLSYVVTDAEIEQADLDVLLSDAVNISFNRITVDGDTSTNDACVLAATAHSGVKVNLAEQSGALFKQAVESLFIDLATAIIRDAEGASKFITLNVMGGKASNECLQVGYTVAESPLVKTAFFASDANWGRILAAIGRAGIDGLVINDVELYLDDYCICQNGGRVHDYNEAHAATIMLQQDITITIKLNRGEYNERLWTSDLSHDYIKINADYRT